VSEGGWSWRAAGPEDREDQRRLFNTCFGKDESVETFVWKYERNPHGAALGRVACDPAGRVVGGYSYVPRRFRRDGVRLVLQQASDAMVDPGWRRRGVFTGLDDVVAEEAGKAGVPWAFAYSGRLSYRGFLGNGWRDIGRARVFRLTFRAAPMLARLGRVRPAVALLAPVLDVVLGWKARRLLRSRGLLTRLERIERFDTRVDELFEACVPPRGLIGERDAPWLNWRYVDTPSGRQECYGLADADSGRLDGYLVAEFFDGHAYLVEHLARDERVREALLRAFAVMAAAREAREATALHFDHHPAAPLLARLGWSRSLKRRLFRDMFPFIVRPCGPHADGDLDVTRWHLWDGDRDAEHMSP